MCGTLLHLDASLYSCFPVPLLDIFICSQETISFTGHVVGSVFEKLAVPVH